MNELHIFLHIRYCISREFGRNRWGTRRFVVEAHGQTSMHSTEEPTEGYFRMRLVHGGPLVGIRIWYGPPLDPTIYDPRDPATHEPMDRMPRWNALANGEIIDLERVWPVCMGDPIEEAEYRYLASTTQWAKRNDGFSPMATPRKKTNWDDSSVPSLGG